MSIKKYVFAAFLGLGICGEISVEFAHGMDDAKYNGYFANDGSIGISNRDPKIDEESKRFQENLWKNSKARVDNKDDNKKPKIHGDKEDRNSKKQHKLAKKDDEFERHQSNRSLYDKQMQSFPDPNGSNQLIVQNITCDKVIRDYIKEVNGNVYGNVLAFECNITVNGIQRDAIIVLKNGYLQDPLYVNNQHANTRIPVYYIPFESVVTGLHISNNYGVRLASGLHGVNDNTVACDRCASAYAKCSYQRGIAPHMMQRGAGFEVLSRHIRPVDFIGGNFAQIFSSIQWFGYARHTEAQLEIIQEYLDNVPLNIRINEQEVLTIRLNNVRAVSKVYSMFEPCHSCRLMKVFFGTQGAPNCGVLRFKYFAIDNDMLHNDGGQVEIFPAVYWSDYSMTHLNDVPICNDYDSWYQYATRYGFNIQQPTPDFDPERMIPQASTRKIGIHRPNRQDEWVPLQ